MSASPEASTVPVTEVPGVGPARAKLLHRLGIHTVEELLRRAPRTYVDARGTGLIGQLEEGRPASVTGFVQASGWRRTRTDRTLWFGTVQLGDDEGNSLQLHFFLKTGLGRRPRPLPGPDDKRRFIATGVARLSKGGGWHMQNPELEPADRNSIHAGRIVPLYPLTDGMTHKMMRRIVMGALERFAHRLPDPLPRFIRRESGLVDLAEALYQLHYPEDENRLHRARQRLAFEELLTLRLAAARGRVAGIGAKGRPLAPVRPKFLATLPFQLTDGQRRVVQEIGDDLSRAVPMQRLLQGDVGSGKTVAVAYALARAALAGGQAALVAPSDVLARQHAATLREWFAVDGIQVDLLRGGTESSKREKLLNKLSRGDALVVVGTHALLQETVTFRRLDVVVVDEQHRFGVEQRRALLRSQQPPHLLVVSATPIPRTLAHVVYGDLDVSVLDEMPPGRQRVDTRWVRPHRRKDVYQFLRRQVEGGAQAFVVFPAIGGGDPNNGDAPGDEELLAAAVALTEGPLVGVPTAIVHGRQNIEEQTKAMERFRRGEAAVLLATSVIEVGLDVPGASIIVIEGADKFGLAQLHQLRGRVGRGGGSAWCFLIAEPRTDNARGRLQALRKFHDGFTLAREDLALRGPGELLGVRQSGLPDLSAIGQDADGSTLELVHRWASRLMKSDPARRTEDEMRLWQEVERRRGEQTVAGSGV